MTLRIRLGLSLLTCLLVLVSSCARSPGKAAPIQPILIFGEQGDGPGQFRNCDSVAVDGQGQLYVSDIQRVQVFSLEGVYLRSIGEPGTGDGQFHHEVIGVAITPDQELVAADLNGYRYQVFDRSGTFRRSFGRKGDGNGEFLEPEGVAVDDAGRIYTADNTRGDIQVWSREGEYLSTIGRPGDGPGELDEPESIAILEQKIYVADEGNGRIQVFDSEGRFLDELGHLPRTLLPPKLLPDDDQVSDPVHRGVAEMYDRYLENDLEGLAFDPRGRLYALNEDEGRIDIFASDGKRLGAFRSAAEGGLRSGDGMAFDPSGERLFVCDQGNDRIQVFALRDIERLALGLSP